MLTIVEVPFHIIYYLANSQRINKVKKLWCRGGGEIWCQTSWCELNYYHENITQVTFLSVSPSSQRFALTHSDD